ncbi:hypothetical protein Tco_0565360 [Tanacetum coccineum]
MKIDSSSRRVDCAGTYELGFCTLSIDVSGFCSGSFEGIETTGVGTRGVEGPSKVLPLLVVIALIFADEGVDMVKLGYNGGLKLVGV